jgi:hypothetical protein
MSIDINDPGVDAVVAIGDYEDVIRDAVREAMRAPELIASHRTLTEVERTELIEQLHELRALLYRLLRTVDSAAHL